MKVKTLSLIAAAFAITLTATPFVAQAQDASPNRQPAKEYGKKGSWQKLGLTEEQKAKMMAIKRNTREEMLKVLTPEQRQQLQAQMQEMRNQRSQRQGRGEGKGKMKGYGFANLNLTEAQKTRMQEIKESSKQQMEAILTPEQRQQLQQMKQNMELRRQQRQNNSN